MFEKISAGRLGGARQALSSGVLVLAAHGVIGAAAVWATLRPQVATGTEPAPRYPEGLRRAGIKGRVVVEAVVDTLGRAEPSSVVIVATLHPGFVAPARDYVMRALFRPARVHGRAVRVLVRVPIDFAITTAR